MGVFLFGLFILMLLGAAYDWDLFAVLLVDPVTLTFLAVALAFVVFGVVAARRRYTSQR